MNKQKTFETVAKHLFQQGKQATDEAGSCVYRAYDGSQCAVGCLIPDELYVKELEGTAVGNIFRKFPEIVDFIGSENLSMLARLQHIHDSRRYWESTEDMKTALEECADDYDLQSGFLAELKFDNH